MESTPSFLDETMVGALTNAVVTRRTLAMGNARSGAKLERAEAPIAPTSPALRRRRVLNSAAVSSPFEPLGWALARTANVPPMPQRSIVQDRTELPSGRRIRYRAFPAA